MAVPDSPMNINARTLKENRLRMAEAAEKQINTRIARSYYRTCSGVQISIKDIPAIFRIVRVAMALRPECSDEALDRLVAATVESYRENWGLASMPGSPETPPVETTALRVSDVVNRIYD